MSADTFAGVPKQLPSPKPKSPKVQALVVLFLRTKEENGGETSGTIFISFCITSGMLDPSFTGSVEHPVIVPISDEAATASADVFSAIMLDKFQGVFSIPRTPSVDSSASQEVKMVGERSLFLEDASEGAHLHFCVESITHFANQSLLGPESLLSCQEECP